jgi:hypothetical protein
MPVSLIKMSAFSTLPYGESVLFFGGHQNFKVQSFDLETETFTEIMDLIEYDRVYNQPIFYKGKIISIGWQHVNVLNVESKEVATRRYIGYANIS